ncbi:hypothetical protein J6590_063261 [Homalodisca vitripennis]|nr:hypothetical protein J6590_063261 [Homalodisca vitripennis]
MPLTQGNHDCPGGKSAGERQPSADSSTSEAWMGISDAHRIREEIKPVDTVDLADKAHKPRITRHEPLPHTLSNHTPLEQNRHYQATVRSAASLKLNKHFPLGDRPWETYRWITLWEFCFYECPRIFVFVAFPIRAFRRIRRFWFASLISPTPGLTPTKTAAEFIWITTTYPAPKSNFNCNFNLAPLVVSKIGHGIGANDCAVTALVRLFGVRQGVVAWSSRRRLSSRVVTPRHQHDSYVPRLDRMPAPPPPLVHSGPALLITLDETVYRTP